MTVLCYEKCSTCKKALSWFDQHHISYTKRPIKEKNPTEKELRTWYKKSGLPLKRFFNTSGLQYKALNLKEKLPTMSEEDMIHLLSTDGMLVKRPLIVDGDTILLGFKEEEYKNHFLKG